ncbi:prephenate dehydrogenase [Thermomonas sp. LB-4]|uniref:prephenate dehydrogenase n=1 Tax=Thermomonas sp. LB-4 TaxID=3102790 RepID=UPI002EDA188B
MSGPPQRPRIGIVGSAGAYGRWLRTFFESRMGLAVIGHDPADPASASEEALLEQADVLLFSAPIRHTPELIGRYAQRSAGREAGRLWLDITSVKAAPVAAMLGSQAEVAGLHPMTAPPKSPTLKGRVLVVCEARLQAWRPWLEALLAALEAECVRATPERHDRAMALVQAMVHATHLAQAGVLREQAAAVGDLAGLLSLRSASFEMDAAIAARILSLNPAIYEDIQFGNPHAPEALRALSAQLSRLATLVGQGDDAARAGFRAEFLEANREGLGQAALAAGNYTYERLGYLLADLSDAHSLGIHLPEDRPGSLRSLLHVFERHGVNIASLHSSRTPSGELHFRLGFSGGTPAGQLAEALAALARSGIGRVLPG